MASTIKVNTIQDAGGNSLLVSNGSGSITTNNINVKDIDWQSVVTSNTTMVAGRGYFVNTTGGAITMTLPASPSAGDTVAVKDYTGTFATNNCTIARNSSNMGGSATDYTASTNNLSLTLVYADSTEGWVSVNDNTTNIGTTYISATGGTTSTSGDYKIHTFNSSSNFVVSTASNVSPNNVVDYLVVAGGGSGPATSGGDGISGGGGGGGFRLYANPSTNPQSGNPAAPKIAPAGITVSAQTYPITVGAGGSKGTAGSSPSWTNGSNSVFSTITSAGGGRGGRGDPSGSGVDGGSGGGGSNGSGAGAGNVPPVSPSQGSDGASGGPASGGGGGGVMSAGTAGGPTGGPGGAGGGVTGFGTAGESSGGKYYFSGGGGGGNGNANSGNSAGSGGLGGAGDGLVPGDGTPATNAGTANTGGGGGGGSDLNPGGSAGSNGGSGIVIIRYKYQ